MGCGIRHAGHAAAQRRPDLLLLVGGLDFREHVRDANALGQVPHRPLVISRDAPDLDATAAQLLHHSGGLGLKRVAHSEHARQRAADGDEDDRVPLQLEA